MKLIKQTSYYVEFFKQTSFRQEIQKKQKSIHLFPRINIFKRAVKRVYVIGFNFLNYAYPGETQLENNFIVK